MAAHQYWVRDLKVWDARTDKPEVLLQECAKEAAEKWERKIFDVSVEWRKVDLETGRRRTLKMIDC